jgi:hypothetical protein
LTVDLEKLIGTRIDGINSRLDELRRQNDADLTLRASVRGIKYLRQAVVPATAGITLQLPAPNQGWMWDIRLISGTLSANDSVAAYIGDTATNNPRLIGYAAPPGASPAQNKFIINPASHSALVNPGEPLFLSTSGTGNITLAMVGYIEFPAERVGVILV